MHPQTQRKIERHQTRQDFRRVFPGEIGDIGFAVADWPLMAKPMAHTVAAALSTVRREKCIFMSFPLFMTVCFHELPQRSSRRLR